MVPSLQQQSSMRFLNPHASENSLRPQPSLSQLHDMHSQHSLLSLHDPNTLSNARRIWNEENPNEKLVRHNAATLKASGLGKFIFAAYINKKWTFVRLNCIQRLIRSLGWGYNEIKLDKDQKAEFLTWRNRVCVHHRASREDNKEKLKPFHALAAIVQAKEAELKKAQHEYSQIQRKLINAKAKLSATKTDLQIYKKARELSLSMSGYSVDYLQVKDKEHEKLLKTIERLSNKLIELDQRGQKIEKELEEERAKVLDKLNSFTTKSKPNGTSTAATATVESNLKSEQS